MAWPVVAERYLAVFEAARVQERRTRFARSRSPVAIPPSDLPEVNLDHLRTLTDETGILQHATFAVPRYAEGYCLDDNARALLLMALIEDSGAVNSRTIRELATRYLAFVAYAFDSRTLRFRNFMSYSRCWSEEVGSDDSHGHAIWALGATIGRAGDPGRTSLSGDLFQAALPGLLDLGSPRAWAYGLLGIDEYLRAFEGDSSVEAARKELVGRLVGLYRAVATPEWPWFESSLTYANARLAQALIVSGGAMRSEEITSIGLNALDWLAKLQVEKSDYFAPVGSNGFYERGGEKAAFDQQPIEAASMVSASLEALRVTRRPIWAEHACRAFDWFLGKNHLHEPVYDAATGGCRDGLHADRANENLGAESTLSFLLALVEMRGSDYARIPRVTNALMPTMPALSITRSRHRLLPDARRVLAKPYSPGEEVLVTGASRAALLMQRVLEIPEPDVKPLLEGIVTSFSHRHRDFEDLLERHFRLVAHLVDSTALLSAERRLLIGAYFTNEYSVEAAALFNPSIVLAPTQGELRDGRTAIRDEPPRGRRGPPLVD